MFASFKKTLGIVDVSSTPKYITVEGIETYVLLKDMYRIWGSNQVGNQMFSVIQSGKLRFLHFFALDFKYICEKLLDDPQTRSSRRVLAKVIHELKEKTWVGDVEREVKSITNEKDLNHLVPFPLKPFQAEFVRHVGKLVPAYRLRGYMLDAGAGTGKTVTQLILAHCLGAKKCIVVVPKNSAERVWQDTIAHIMLMKKPYWVSTDGKPLHTEAYYYVVHYEQLQQMLDFVKLHPRDFEGSYLGLDESHNFNRIASDRTQAFIDMAGMPQIMMNLWASGTPIQALGIECIPFLKCIDPMFTDEAEERFRKIYGRDAKRANDILRNRIGHLKYHVPKQDVVDIPVHTQTVLVKMPNAMEYTLEAIGEKMRKFIMEREAFYAKHKEEFKADYERALLYFEQHAQFNKADYAAYKAAVALISKGFDPKLMKAEAQLANGFERKVIIPALPNAMKEDFRKAKSVVKYVNLTIMGECLGTVLGGSRSKCHLEMVENIDFSQLIDGAKKKTLIFTSFVEVLERAASLIDQKGYQSARVYGATNKDLSKIVKEFYENDDINPLLATYPSLSTAVPLTVASRILMINQPFRDAIRTQTIARAARLGQDTAVDVVDLLLDTGDKPNISTRSNDIMQWSAEMTASILGVANVDLDSMQLESKNRLLDELLEYAEESFDNQWLGGPAAPVSIKAEYTSEPLVHLPPYLYHSSAYKQDQLKPGFQHSGVLVKWDKTEDNTWLYAADKKDEAIMLGISSAIEKKWDLSRYKYDAKTRRLDIEVCDQTITKADIEKLSVYIYTLRPESSDGWVENFNPVNGLKGEYKTQGKIDKNILRCEHVDVQAALRGYSINIKKVAGEFEASLEGLSAMDTIGIVGSVLFHLINPISWMKIARGRTYDDPLFGKTKQEQKEHDAKHSSFDITNIKWNDLTKVESYLDREWSDAKINAMTQVTGTVNGSGFGKHLTWGNQFDFKDPVGFQKKMMSAYDQFVDKHAAAITNTSRQVEAIDEKTRATVKGLGDKFDDHEVGQLLDKAAAELNDLSEKFANSLRSVKVAVPDAHTIKMDKGWLENRADPSAKPVGQVPTLTKEQAKQYIRFLKERVKGIHEFERLYKGARWGDHSDGDKFWDMVDHISGSEEFAGAISHHDWDDKFVFGVMDEAEVVGHVLMGGLAWISHSLK